jgi:hypothetical protein
MVPEEFATDALLIPDTSTVQLLQRPPLKRA